MRKVAKAVTKTSTLPKNLFTGEIDMFKGITIENMLQAMSSPSFKKQEFASCLQASLQHWQQEKLRAAWIKIPIEYSTKCLASALKMGFVVHHAEPTHLVLNKWLSEKEPNKMPPFCTHFVGCGGVVLDLAKQNILLIQERFLYGTNQMAADAVPWKIPGGNIDAGEDLSTCAEREVFEETGVRAKFQGILGMRHMHNFRFGKSDMYFACLLTPQDTTITMDKGELSKCEWIPISEYLKMNLAYRVQQVIRESVKQHLGNPNLLWSVEDVSQYSKRVSRWYATIAKKE